MKLKIIKDLGKYLPIIQLTIDDWPERKKEILKLFDNSKLLDNDSVLNNYSEIETGDNYITDEYYRILKTELEVVFQKLELQEVSIDQAWFECAEKNMYHGLHNHGALGFSSCLYVDYNHEEHQPLTLVAPYTDPYDGEVIEYIPNGVYEGTLIVFPSCLPHFTEPNQSDNRRLVMAANYQNID